MRSFVACFLMAAISIPVSYVVARCFLRGFIRIAGGRANRNVL